MNKAPALIDPRRKDRTPLLPVPLFAQPVWNRRVRDWAVSK